MTLPVPRPSPHPAAPPDPKALASQKADHRAKLPTSGPCLQLLVMLENGSVPSEAELALCREAAKRFLAEVPPFLAPAEPGDLSTELLVLESHKRASVGGVGVDEVDEALRRRFWADYLDDLSTYPLWAIREMCREMRRDAEIRFFPSSGEMLRCLRRIMGPVWRCQRAAETAQSYRRPPPREPVTQDEIDEIRRKAGLAVRRETCPDHEASDCEPVHSKGCADD